MPRRLLDDSPHHAGYSTINDNPSELEQKTIEEAAAAMQNRLPGRSRKAKGRFRRQQRGIKGDEWRGRLSSYCEASSYDLEKLTKRLKEERSLQFPSESGKLYAMRWRVKAHFDVLHLHGIVIPKFAKSSSLRVMPAVPVTPKNVAEKEVNQMDLVGYQTYDTEVSDVEGKGLSALQGAMTDGGGQVQQDYASEDDTVDIFLFAFGPVIFWGFQDQEEELALLSDLRAFVDGAFHDLSAAEDAMEEMEFTYSETTRIVNDLIELTTSKSGEKLSVSCAIAQSCHLSVHEWRLSRTIERNSHIPKELAETGMIHMSGDDISKEMGRLFVERNLINLEPELLE